MFFNLIYFISHLVHQLGFLLGGSELEELLDDVVTEDVRHQTVGGGEDLLEHQLLLSGRGPLQLLLDEPGAVLVLAELHDVVGQVSQLEVGVAIVPANYPMKLGSVFKQNCMQGNEGNTILARRGRQSWLGRADWL